MAEVFYIKKGDTAPSVEATLRNRDRSPIDLTDAASVNFQMGSLDGACVIVDPATSGVVRYDWDTNDTATAGVFDAEFKVTWNDAREQTVPSRGTIRVYITEDVE